LGAGRHARSNRAFDTRLETIGQVLAGPWPKPINALLEQTYDNHVSLHHDAMAQKLGFKAAPIEGPTHFSQFAPLGEAVWGERFLSEGCLSAHYRNMVMEGEEVRAFIGREPGEDHAKIWATKRDGTEVLKGTASVGPQAPPTALDIRLNELGPLEQPVILRDLRVGQRTQRGEDPHGCEPAYGCALPLLAQRQAVENHRAVELVLRRRHAMETGDHSLRDDQRAAAVRGAAGWPGYSRACGGTVCLPGDQTHQTPVFVGED